MLAWLKNLIERIEPTPDDEPHGVTIQCQCGATCDIEAYPFGQAFLPLHHCESNQWVMRYQTQDVQISRPPSATRREPEGMMVDPEWFDDMGVE